MNTQRCLLLILSIGLLSAVVSVPAADAKKPNVLFIAIDDLNHWVGHLGRHPQTKTPNIDRLAKLGVTFTKAYCTAPSCNPSRASLMSGLRPSTTGCYNNSQPWHPAVSDDKLLNTHFAKNGYRVYGAGKIYHSSERGGTWTDYGSGSKDAGAKKALTLHPSAKDDGVDGIKFGPLANSDEEMPDYSTVSYCLEKMAEKSDQPFFIACGFVKPHMPFSVPKKWFDLFPLETIQLPPHREDDLADVPPAGVKMAGPDRDHADIVKSGRWKEAVQAYLATIAFFDAQLGRLLDGWEKSPQRDNTVICLWSDHGWSLGEKSHWRKFALWEEPTRTVFIWKAPGVTPAGIACDRPVDYASVYPTLCSLTGLPKPAHLEGHDITPLLKNPKAAWEHPALTTWGLKNHAIRTEGWRYIRYADGSEELYNEQTDPLEYTNLAKDPKYSGTKQELSKWLPKTDAKDLPGGKGGGEDEADAKNAARKAKKNKQ
jgi:arylsulfatase A-like enzyme